MEILDIISLHAISINIMETYWRRFYSNENTKEGCLHCISMSNLETLRRWNGYIGF